MKINSYFVSLAAAGVMGLSALAGWFARDSNLKDADILIHAGERNGKAIMVHKSDLGTVHAQAIDPERVADFIDGKNFRSVEQVKADLAQGFAANKEDIKQAMYAMCSTARDLMPHIEGLPDPTRINYDDPESLETTSDFLDFVMTNLGGLKITQPETFAPYEADFNASLEATRSAEDLNALRVLVTTSAAFEAPSSATPKIKSPSPQ